jgi:hypothetical protein
VTLRSLARRAGLGQLAYLGWHAPRGFAKRCAREGPVNLWLSARGRAAMIRAAGRLPALPRPTSPTTLTVHFLTGRLFWYQTAFCAYSLLRHSADPIRVVLIDDGSLGEAEVGPLRRVLPDVAVVSADEVRDRLDAHLPAAQYPALRARRLVYPHLRKLTDVHAGQAGWRVVLDSDMLFHRRPAALLDWLRAPTRPCHMVDVENAYGYTPGLLRELAGGPVPDRVNVGVCGLRSDDIDWDRLEAWCRATLDREGSHYLQEQALTALLLAGRDRVALDETEYVVRPSRDESRRPRAALHHYVAEAKAWYFRYGWQTVEALG